MLAQQFAAPEQKVSPPNRRLSCPPSVLLMLSGASLCLFTEHSSKQETYNEAVHETQSKSPDKSHLTSSREATFPVLTR